MRGKGGHRGSNQGNRGDRGNRGFDSNAPTVECGTFDKLCQGNAIFKLSTKDKCIPLTKTNLYDSKKNDVGFVKDVFGTLEDVSFVLEPRDPSFLSTLSEGSKIYAQQNRLKPESFFLADQIPDVVAVVVAAEEEEVDAVVIAAAIEVVIKAIGFETMNKNILISQN